MSESKNLVNPNARSEDWDDTAILNSFESGIMSFRTKAQSKPTATNVGTAAKDVTREPITSTVRGNDKRTPPGNESDEIESGPAKRVRYPQEDPLTDLPGTSVDADEKGETVGSLPLPAATGLPIHDEALQSMLMAWYYSGYATGRYQALKEMEDAAAATAAVASAESENISLDKNTA